MTYLLVSPCIVALSEPRIGCCTAMTGHRQSLCVGFYATLPHLRPFQVSHVSDNRSGKEGPSRLDQSDGGPRHLARR